MTEGSAPGQDSYLVGGNLLNEQDNILKAKKKHEAAERKSSVREPEEAAPEPDRKPEPAQPAQSITEEQQTHGGGAVPPGSAGDDDA